MNKTIGVITAMGSGALIKINRILKGTSKNWDLLAIERH